MTGNSHRNLPDDPRWNHAQDRCLTSNIDTHLWAIHLQRTLRRQDILRVQRHLEMLYRRQEVFQQEVGRELNWARQERDLESQMGVLYSPPIPLRRTGRIDISNDAIYEEDSSSGAGQNHGPSINDPD